LTKAEFQVILKWPWVSQSRKTGILTKEGIVGFTFDHFRKAVKDFLFGATSFEIHQTVRHEKLARRDLILLFSFGDLLGVPVFPPYYSLRLLPYFYPALESWKKRMVKEKDLSEISSL
jgi:hypothetical protein